MMEESESWDPLPINVDLGFWGIWGIWDFYLLYIKYNRCLDF
jgi:hypothetical protein